MTEGEQEAVLGKAAAELAEARKTLACLNAKADAFRQELRGALTLLENIEGHLLTEPASDHFPTYSAIKDVRQKIRDTKARIAELEEHLKRAGVIGAS